MSGTVRGGTVVDSTVTLDPVGGVMTSETIDGYSVPVDPMDDLHCESCQ